MPLVADLPATGTIRATLPRPETVRWQRGPATTAAVRAMPPLLTAIGRGLFNRCPSCGQGPVFAGFLRVVPICTRCATPLGLARADDAPPYFTIVIVGHVVVPLMLLFERAEAPPTWLATLIFVPLSLGLALALLRPVKGATVGLMLKLDLLKQDDDDR